MTFYRDKYRVETTRLQNWDYASDGSYFITICTKNSEHLFGNIESGEMKLNDHGCIVQKCWFELAAHYHNLQLDAFMVMPNHIHGIMTIDNSRVETGFKPVSLSPGTNAPVSIQSGTNAPVSIQSGTNAPVSIQSGTNAPVSIQSGTNAPVSIQSGTNAPVSIQSGTNAPVQTGFKPVSIVLVATMANETGFKPVSTALGANVVNETGFKPVSTATTTVKHGIFEFVRALKTFSSRQMNEMDHTPGKTWWQTRFHDHIIRDEQEFQRIEHYILNNPSVWENDSLKS